MLVYNSEGRREFLAVAETRALETQVRKVSVLISLYHICGVSVRKEAE